MGNMASKRAALRLRDGDNCFYCGQTMKFEPTWRKTGSRPFRVFPAEEATAEHLVDRQHGGTNDLTNLVLACRRCNNGRNYMTTRQKLSDAARLKEKDHE